MKTPAKYTLLTLGGMAALGAVILLVKAAATFIPDDQPIGHVGGFAMSNFVVSSGNEILYAIDYDGTDWSGNLHAYVVSSDGVIDDDDLWDDGIEGAAGQLDILSDAAVGATKGWDATRKIVTVTSSGNKVGFRWANLTNTDKAALDPSTAVAAASSPLLNYLRGDRSNEAPSGLDFRARGSVLGAIVHSTPLFWNDGTNKTVFVGANDGMLHAFDADSGIERFAYIPSSLLGKLKNLNDATTAFKYFVDGQLAIRKIDNNTTVLAGALGAGGQALFGLNVANAAAASEADAASKILWEITNATANYTNLGHVFGRIAIAKLPSGANALIVGNGYNNTGNGQASLYLINPVTGARIAEISTGTGSSGSPNGLSSVSLLDTDGDGDVEFAYAGDIGGNLWKFNLTSNTATKLHTTNPAQAITMAPVVSSHPQGGYMVNFVTGRMFNASDKTDNATHYAYGIWDGAPAANAAILSQTLTERSYDTVSPNIRVRSVSANTPNWTSGAANHMGWKVALPAGGERVVGDGAVFTGGVFLFLSSNPTVAPTANPPYENWWMQLNALTGGSIGQLRFDLNGDGAFTVDDRVKVSAEGVTPVVTDVPVGRHIGGGIRSQFLALSAGKLDVFQASLDRNNIPSAPIVVGDGPGVSGGHFDYDIYYFNTTTTTSNVQPTGLTETRTGLCLKESDVNAQLNKISDICAGNGFTSGYGYMSARTKTNDNSCAGGNGKNKSVLHSISCRQFTAQVTTVIGDYMKAKHEHEYDDKYDVTGVNMLNASLPAFNLTPNVIPTATATTPEFKILVMNQFLNPAAKLAVGNQPEVSVKTYNNLASQTDAQTLLAALPTYTRANITNLVFNLPLDAFKSKDWWGTEQPVAGVDLRADGDGVARAGLIPTQTGCVNKVDKNGIQSTPGKFGERFNGALTIQIIRANTPSSALEFNHNGGGGLTSAQRARYGWRVKAADFKTYVIAEYTAFWHHPNGKCYEANDWVGNPPEDNESSEGAQTPAAGSQDPKDGVFVSGGGGGGDEETPGGENPPAPPPPTTGIIVGGVVDTDTPGYGSEPVPDPVTGIIPLPPFNSGVASPSEPTGRINWRELR